MKSRIETFVDLVHLQGSVLQIGFESHCASRIQTHKPIHHTILLSDLAELPLAKEWSQQHPHVILIPDTWQATLPSLGSFDTILALPNNKEMAQISTQDTLLARALLQKEKELRHFVQEAIPELSLLRYSDDDIQAFFQNLPPAQNKEASYFLLQLHQRGHITEEQYEKFIAQYQLTRTAAATPTPETTDPLFPLLMTCLDGHLAKNGCFAALLDPNNSQYENAQFFENIITNPHCDYKEQPIVLPGIEEPVALLMRVQLI